MTFNPYPSFKFSPFKVSCWGRQMDLGVHSLASWIPFRFPLIPTPTFSISFPCDSASAMCSIPVMSSQPWSYFLWLCAQYFYWNSHSDKSFESMPQLHLSLKLLPVVKSRYLLVAYSKCLPVTLAISLRSRWFYLTRDIRKNPPPFFTHCLGIPLKPGWGGQSPEIG